MHSGWGRNLVYKKDEMLNIIGFLTLDIFHLCIAEAGWIYLHEPFHLFLLSIIYEAIRSVHSYIDYNSHNPLSLAAYWVCLELKSWRRSAWKNLSGSSNDFDLQILRNSCSRATGNSNDMERMVSFHDIINIYSIYCM